METYVPVQGMNCCNSDEGLYVLKAEYDALSSQLAECQRERDENGAAVSKQAFEAAQYRVQRDKANAKVNAYENALTFSPETKAAYCSAGIEEEHHGGEGDLEWVPVSWESIQDVMKAIKARAALANTAQGQEVQGG